MTGYVTGYGRVTPSFASQTDGYASYASKDRGSHIRDGRDDATAPDSPNAYRHPLSQLQRNRVTYRPPRKTTRFSSRKSYASKRNRLSRGLQ